MHGVWVVCAGAAAQFFCEVPSKTGTSTDTNLASDTYDECVYREDTLVLLELTTRDMMEVCTPQAPCSPLHSSSRLQYPFWSCTGCVHTDLLHTQNQLHYGPELWVITSIQRCKSKEPA